MMNEYNFLDATPQKIRAIASKAQYIQDLCNNWLSSKEYPIPGETEPPIPRTLADDILRQLESIADAIGPYTEEEDDD